ncbi:hypothetical protein AVEN_1342-1 [Araneus ventricosus]|uniref:Uncharacterized protein n=1 Tax=Araneus ventricosus TaxID=182803 RepID=A0A4Y2D2R2_ARAVE|nr:hypothetical protein AVEN_1342-1 [Araneus ventricosus]
MFPNTTTPGPKGLKQSDFIAMSETWKYEDELINMELFELKAFMNNTLKGKSDQQERKCRGVASYRNLNSVADYTALFHLPRNICTLSSLGNAVRSAFYSGSGTDCSQNERCGVRRADIVLLHNNTIPAALRTQQLLQRFRGSWEMFAHSAYSPGVVTPFSGLGLDDEQYALGAGQRQRLVGPTVRQTPPEVSLSPALRFPAYSKRRYYGLDCSPLG